MNSMFLRHTIEEGRKNIIRIQGYLKRKIYVSYVLEISQLLISNSSNRAFHSKLKRKKYKNILKAKYEK